MHCFTQNSTRRNRYVIKFEGKSRPWDIERDESDEAMLQRWNKTNGMNYQGMHMVSGGRVVNWSDMRESEDGATVQVMGNVQGGMGKRGKRKKERRIWDEKFGGRTIRSDGRGGDHGETSKRGG